MKQFFFREPSEIIWRLKKIKELQIKKNDYQFKRRVDRSLNCFYTRKFTG